MSNSAGGWPLQLLKKAAIAAGQDCVLCAGRSDAALVCGTCAQRLIHAPPDWWGEAEGPGAVDAGIAAFDYGFPVDRLVHRFKFAGDLAVGHWLSLELVRAVAGAPQPDLLVAPPLTPASLRQRGFNQAVEIAKVASHALGIPLDPRCVVKTRETPPQPALGGRARRENLRGAFRCDRVFGGEHVAIVDDVITTGATVESIARELRAHGAGRVSAWAVARTPGPRR